MEKNLTEKTQYSDVLWNNSIIQYMQYKQKNSDHYKKQQSKHLSTAVGNEVF